MISTGTRGRQQQWRFPRGAALPPRILLQRLLCFHTLCSRTTIVHTRTFVPFAGHFCSMRAYCSRRASPAASLLSSGLWSPDALRHPARRTTKCTVLTADQLGRTQADDVVRIGGDVRFPAHARAHGEDGLRGVFNPSFTLFGPKNPTHAAFTINYTLLRKTRFIGANH